MFRIKSEFDYESIIEACGIQDVNLKKSLDEKDEHVTKLQTQCDTLKKLSKERDEKVESLSQLKFTLGKNLLKLNKYYDKISTLNKKHSEVQEEIAQLQLKYQEESDDFVKKFNQKDNELKGLYSQFEGETLTNILSALNTELLATQDEEIQLQNYCENLKSTVTEATDEKLAILKNLITGAPDSKQIEEFEKKLANKKKNIQFLTVENNKKMELLQKFN